MISLISFVVRGNLRENKRSILAMTIGELSDIRSFERVRAELPAVVALWEEDHLLPSDLYGQIALAEHELGSSNPLRRLGSLSIIGTIAHSGRLMIAEGLCRWLCDDPNEEVRDLARYVLVTIQEQGEE